jgi:hypothetical protein
MNMNVYLVKYFESGEPEIMGVYASKELAEINIDIRMNDILFWKSFEEREAKKKFLRPDFSIIEMDLVESMD